MRAILEFNDDSKALHLLQYLKSLDFVTVQTESEEVELPDWQKELLDVRLKDYQEHPDEVEDFDKMLEELRKKL
jgi:hypothetical protein